MQTNSPVINVMMRAASKAARKLKRDFGEVSQLQVSRKGPADFVSTADLEAQRTIREELSRARPDFGFLMEEGDNAASKSATGERWIVDPLDGTTNFLHGVPHWCISIAVERMGEIVAGLVYNPITDESFYAEKGTGAFGDGKRMRVSARTDLTECLIATGIPFRGSSKPLPSFLKEMGAVAGEVAGIRRAGAAALDLAYVAAGRYDGFWESGLLPWDIAAGVLLVREAGGSIVPLIQGEDFMKTGSLVAGNAEVQEKLTTLLRGAVR